jgi:hypothetical protein
MSNVVLGAGRLNYGIAQQAREAVSKILREIRAGFLKPLAFFNMIANG